MKTNTVALIGGAGFVGTRLRYRFLESKVRFVSFDAKRVVDGTSTLLDIEQPSSLASLEGADTIINLAAVHRDDIRPLSRYDDVNVEGSRNVCNAARELGIQKIIFTSSVAVYGFAPENTGEEGEINYFNDYGRTKFLAEEIYKQWQREDPDVRTLVIVRPTVIFGEGNRGNVFNLLRQVASGKFVMFGAGVNKKSMAYVENVAAFLEFSLGFGEGIHVYNYVDKPDMDMNSLIAQVRGVLFGKPSVGLRLPAVLGVGVGYLADIASRIIRRPLPVSSIRVKKFLTTTQFDSAVHETGFTAPVELSVGLSRTLSYEFLEDNCKRNL